MLKGAGGFAVVSLVGFSVWAFAGKRLYAKAGEAGLYAACLLGFLGSSGLLLHSLVRGPRSFARFYRIFVPAFIAYAVTWCAAWFALRFGLGEWLGSLLGSIAFVAAAGWGLGNYHGFVKAVVVFFAFHSAGYFLGGKLMYWLVSPGGATILAGLSKAQVSLIAKLCWGILYGSGFGAGMGYTFHAFQRQPSGSNAV